MFRTKVHALGQMWAKWGQAKGKPIVEGRDWTQYDRSTGRGLKIVLGGKKAGPKSIESRSWDHPPGKKIDPEGKKIAPELVLRPSLEILEPKGRPRALLGAPRDAPGTSPGWQRSSM